MTKKIIILIILTSLFSGCSDKSNSVVLQEVSSNKEVNTPNDKPSQDTAKPINNTPEKMLKETLEAIKNTDMIKLSELLSEEEASSIDDADAFIELLKTSNKTLEYDIKNVEIDGDKANAIIDCSYGDITEIFSAAFAGYFEKSLPLAMSENPPSNEEMGDILNNEILTAIKTYNPKPYAATITIPCIKSNDKWEIENAKDNAELADMITGNLTSKLKEISDAMGSEQ